MASFLTHCLHPTLHLLSVLGKAQLETSDDDVATWHILHETVECISVEVINLGLIEKLLVMGSFRLLV